MFVLSNFIDKIFIASKSLAKEIQVEWIITWEKSQYFFKKHLAKRESKNYQPVNIFCYVNIILLI